MKKTAWSLTLDQIIPGWEAQPPKNGELTLGVFPGEGIGPAVIDVSLRILETISRRTATPFKIHRGGKIGIQAYQESGRVLPPDVIEFCESIFHRGGAVLCGPAGGRFVYELRAHFGLFCKITPIRPLVSLLDTGAIKRTTKEGVDILIVRENTGGIYLGYGEEISSPNGKAASHTFEYREEEVERIMRVALGLARSRRQHLTLILKSEGIPAISRLWLEVAERLMKNSGVNFEVMQVDHAAFELVHSPQRFDVVITSNLFGDILSDGCGVMLGSRGMCFSGNFGMDRRAVYQTGHGAAKDIEGRNLANPIGQILSLVMMLQVSFHLPDAAKAVLAAVEQTLEDGWRTADIAGPGNTTIGTKELGDRIIHSLEKSFEEQKNEAG